MVLSLIADLYSRGGDKLIIYSISNDTVLNIGNKIIDFKQNIKKIIEIRGILIVHIFDDIDKKGYIEMPKQPINGVYAIDSNGDIQWNIKEIFKSDNMYTNIQKDEDGGLKVSTFDGIEYKIDIVNQKIISSSFTK